MRPRTIALALVLLGCLAILADVSRSPYLLRDTDTQVLLAAIRERSDPLSWFGGDWPLQNHFYRPVSTLVFEMDNAIYGADPFGYGFTNAMLCAACVFLLYAFVRELFESEWVGCSCALLFAAWTLDYGPALSSLAMWLTLPLAMLVYIRDPVRWHRALVVGLVGLYISFESRGVQPLESRMIEWLPGRTASVMTVFCLGALACYARSERLRKLGRLRESTLCAACSVFAVALALGSYEQAVMLPAVLFGVAVVIRLNGGRPAVGWHFAYWALLVAYLVVRHRCVPNGVSSYQAQQFRDGSGVALSIADYALPAAGQIPTFRALTGIGFGFLYVSRFYTSVLFVIDNLTTIWAAFRGAHRTVILAGYAMSLIAFLPMAWVKYFAHYHYWPMAMRTMLVVGLAMTLWRLVEATLSQNPMVPVGRGSGVLEPKR